MQNVAEVPDVYADANWTGWQHETAPQGVVRWQESTSKTLTTVAKSSADGIIKASNESSVGYAP